MLFDNTHKKFNKFYWFSNYFKLFERMDILLKKFKNQIYIQKVNPENKRKCPFANKSLISFNDFYVIFLDFKLFILYKYYMLLKKKKNKNNIKIRYSYLSYFLYHIIN